MMDIKRKAISILTGISFIGAGVFLPIAAYGATVNEIQAQINALLVELQAMQSQSAQVSVGAVSSGCSFTRNLTVGSRGDDVKCLQKYLNMASYSVASSGAGSSGNESTYFGLATKSALARWQAANGISPASGYFGPISRAKYGSLAKPAVITEIPVPAAPPEVLPAIPVIATPTPVVVPEPVLPNPFESTLKIEMTLNSMTLSSYGEKTLAIIKLSSDEKIGITRIRFINKGTFRNSYITNFKLLANSDSGPLVSETGGSADGTVEFNLVSDSSKVDKGLLVSGNTYYLRGYLNVPAYGSEKPYIRMDLESASDISAHDYNNLNRAATITGNNSFPIRGPQITAF